MPSNTKNGMRLLGMVAGTLFTLPFLSLKAIAAPSYPYSILHTFSGNGADAINGERKIIQGTDGNFYGINGVGSNNSVIKITPSGTCTIVHTFGDGSVADDGSQPQGDLCLGPDGSLYGTTTYGGNSSGTIYKIATDGTYSILHYFSDGSVANDGANPEGGLTLGPDGNFYGATYVGGLSGNGVLYKMTPSGAITILHSFYDFDHGGANDGRQPIENVAVDSSGNIYGVTIDDIVAGFGIVYKITPSGVYTILHRFMDGSVADDGNGPLTPTVGPDGNLYGLTHFGGPEDDGTMYKIAQDGTYTILHTFSDEEAVVYPKDGMILGSDGNFYGTTALGGTTTAFGGTIFKATTTGAITIMHSFGDDSVPGDGNGPQRGLAIGFDGNFYGITGFGGSADHGVLFRISPVNLVVSAPSTATAGSPFNVTVTARNNANNIVTDYTGPLHFTSDDPTAALPADATLTNGTGSFSTALYSAATKTIRARDINSPDITATSAVAVSPGLLDHLALTTPTATTAGMALYAMLSARDRYNNVISSFTDTIHLSSIDTQAVLPANFVLTGGAKQLTIKLNTPGTQTVTATDTKNSLAVTSGNIAVGTAIAKYLITGPATSTVGAVNTYTITAKDNVGNTVPGYTGTVHFTTTDPTATVPGDIMLVNGTGTFQVTFRTKGAQKVNANDTVNTAVKGLASTTVK